jgi:G:T-mismatch repair DNA endonuclease (very short patch repair protein)
VKAIRDLARDGVDALVIWECQTRDSDRLRRSLVSFLGPA